MTPIWRQNRWADPDIWDQVSALQNRSRVVIVEPSRICPTSVDGRYTDTYRLADDFWNWAEENAASLGNFYYLDLGSDWFDQPSFAHLDFSQLESGTQIAMILLFSTEQAALFFKMGFL